MSNGVLLIGVGMILTAIIDYVAKTAYGWFIFVVFFIMGFVIITIAQRRYNGGFLSRGEFYIRPRNTNL